MQTAGSESPSISSLSSPVAYHGAFLLQDETIKIILFLEKECAHPEFIANHFIGELIVQL